MLFSPSKINVHWLYKDTYQFQILMRKPVNVVNILGKPTCLNFNRTNSSNCYLVLFFLHWGILFQHDIAFAGVATSWELYSIFCTGNDCRIPNGCQISTYSLEFTWWHFDDGIRLLLLLNKKLGYLLIKATEENSQCIWGISAYHILNTTRAFIKINIYDCVLLMN